MGPSGLAWDAKEQVEWSQLGYDISSRQGPQRRSPPASAAAVPWTAAGAGEATAAAEGRAAGTLGLAPAVVARGADCRGGTGG